MSLRFFSVPTHRQLSKDSVREGTPKPHLGRVYFQILAFAACISQSVIMTGCELEPSRRQFRPNYLWEVIRSFEIAICGADCGINFLCLSRLALVLGNPNPSTEYGITRLLQWGAWNFISSLPSSGASQFFFSFSEQKNSSFPDSARWGICPQKTASRAESSKAHNDRSPGHSQRQLVLWQVSLQSLQIQRSFSHPWNPPAFALGASIQFPTLAVKIGPTYQECLKW